MSTELTETATEIIYRKNDHCGKPISAARRAAKLAAIEIEIATYNAMQEALRALLK